MAQSSAFIYSADPEALKALRETAQGVGAAVKSEQADLEEAIRDAASWTIAPDILVLDMSGVEDPPAALERLAEAGPSAKIAVIVVSDKEDLRLARKLREIGVVDYLLKPLVREEIVDALTAAMSQTDAERLSVESSKLITVTGSEGGVGVSTVAAALASRITRRKPKARVLLLDLDFVSGTQFILHGGDKTSGLISAVREPARLDTVALDRIVGRTENPNLLLLSEPGELKETPDAAAANLFLAWCTRAFDHVVVDLPRHAEWARPALSLSSRIVYMTRPSFSGAVQLGEFAEAHDGQLIDDALVLAINDACGVGRQAVAESHFTDRVKAPLVRLPHDPVALEREIVEEEMKLTNTKFGKALAALDGHLPLEKAAMAKPKKEAEKKGFGRFLQWLGE